MLVDNEKIIFFFVNSQFPKVSFLLSTYICKLVFFKMIIFILYSIFIFQRNIIKFVSHILKFILKIR